MNFFCKSIFITATLAAAAPAHAATISIDFENYTNSSVIAAGTDVGGGLSFDRTVRISNDGLLENSPATTGNVAFAPNQIYAQGDDVVGSFARAVSNLRLGAGDLGFDTDTVVLTAYDAMQNVIGTDSFQGSASQFLEVTGTGIASFLLAFDDVRPPAGTGSGGFDNITFDLAAVPVPASLPLMGAGLLAFGWVRKRRQTS